ncbi:hypothetical protein [Defluviitalea saccharophila]|uniref:Uncharacterized protein n=1 Tax=Defluviitalea saccharophila TaxID=879970 RepID=A0ABZ2Y505_9FIRM
MILINIKKFKEISIVECINHSIEHEIDSYIKRVVGDTIATGKKSHGFNKMEQDAQIEYFLKYSLLRIVPSSQWTEYSDEQDNAADSLYIALKRHYFLTTGNFPE